MLLEISISCSKTFALKQSKEFKVIWGDPRSIIREDYVKKYTASFLNSNGGDILFGIEEDRVTKIGCVVELCMSIEDRQELLQESSEMICNFWPPLSSGQFFMEFIKVKCDVSKNLLKYPENYKGEDQQFVVARLTNNSNVPKLLNIVKSKGISHCAVLRLGAHRYGLLVKNVIKLNLEDLISELKKASETSKLFQMDIASLEEVQAKLKDLCVVRLHVNPSPLPIHLTSPPLTFCLDQEGKMVKMEPSQLLEWFVRRDYKFEPEKLLNPGNRFDNKNTSFLHALICSLFTLRRDELDLYGIVVPEWSLVLDFDQCPNRAGHLLNIFRPLHDLHQVEQKCFVKTPVDKTLNLDPKNGVCWCAVRGYEDISKTLSEEDLASWMTSHWHNTRALLDKLITHINPNQLVGVCLWNDGYEILLPYVDMVLRHLSLLGDPQRWYLFAPTIHQNSQCYHRWLSLLSEMVLKLRRKTFLLPYPMKWHIMSGLSSLHHTAQKSPSKFQENSISQRVREQFQIYCLNGFVKLSKGT